MSWTTFAALTSPAPLSELDGNFGTLSGLVPIPCTVTGTNALTLTSFANAAAISAYKQNMQLTAIAVATNSGAVTAALGTLPALPVYVDTPAGPAALVGTEIVQLCEFGLIYDSNLNSGGGGWHLKNAAGALVGQNLTVLNLNVTGTGTIAGLTLGGTLNLVSLTVSGPAALTSLTATGPASLSSLSINSGTPILRYTSMVGTIAYGTIGPASSILGSISFAGCKLSDVIDLGWSVTPQTSVVFTPYVSAPGTVVVSALNPLAGVTISAFTITARFVQIGFN
jgi:hypothetical protein